MHDHSCAVYSPEDQYPESLRFLPVTMNAYGRGRQLILVRHVPADGVVEQVIDDLLSSPEVDYIHVRNTEAGCYLFRIERLQQQPEGGVR